MKFELVSPEKLLLSTDATIVTVPGADGDFGVLANHSPVMTSLRPGLVEAELSDGRTESYFVRGGFADVTPDSVTILAEFAVPRSELTREVFAEQRRLAQVDHDAYHEAGDDEKKANARSFLDQLNHLEPVLLPA